MPLFAKLALYLMSGAVTTYAPGHEFGRFGFVDHLDLPSMEVTKEGFHSKNASSSTFNFASPSTSWRALETAAAGQTVLLDGGGMAPKKISANLFTPWTNFFCPDGCELKLPKDHKIFLTWPEGSVTAGVPTPSVRWILVSFDNPQPPVLIAVPGSQTTTFQLSEEKENLTLHFGSYKGWVQVAYPIAETNFATANVGDLGKLAKKVAPELPFLLGPEAHLVSAETHESDQGLVATWTFNGLPMVPPALKLAPQGGYAVQLLSKASDSGLKTTNGPLIRADEPVIKVLFPCRRFPAGRAIASEGPKRQLPATVSAVDPPSILALASEDLCFDRDPLARSMSENASEEYLLSSNYSMEEWTRQPMPYNSKDQGLALTGAYALLQAILALDDPKPADPEFLIAVLDRLDWSTWMPYGELGVGREEIEAGASAAAAAAFSSDLHIRLKGAMLEAGLAANHVLHPSKVMPNSSALREHLYGVNAKAEDPLFALPRVFSSQSFIAIANPEGIELRWIATSLDAQSFALQLPQGCKVVADSNVDKLIVTLQNGISYIQLKAKSVGPSSLVLAKKGLKPAAPAALAL